MEDNKASHHGSGKLNHGYHQPHMFNSRGSGEVKSTKQSIESNWSSPSMYLYNEQVADSTCSPVGEGVPVIGRCNSPSIHRVASRPVVGFPARVVIWLWKRGKLKWRALILVICTL